MTPSVRSDRYGHDCLRQVAPSTAISMIVFVFVNNDRRHISWSHCVDHELRRVVIPQNDINSFSAQLKVETTWTRAPRIPTCSTDRVDTLVVGFHRNFRTGAPIASRRFNLLITSSPISGTSITETKSLLPAFLWFRTAANESAVHHALQGNGVQNTANTVAWTEALHAQRYLSHVAGSRLQRCLATLRFDLQEMLSRFTFFTTPVMISPS